MTYDLILVPQGAEAAAVQRGAKRAQANIPILTIAMGPKATAQRLLSALQQGVFEGKYQVLVLGVAGSLTSSLRVGDVVVYQTIVAESSAAPYSAAQPEAAPSSVKQPLVSIEEVLNKLPQAQAVKALSCDRLVHLAQEKQTLHVQTGAEAVDMEAAAIAEALTEADVELTTVRVISDSAEHDLPNLAGTQKEDGSLDSWAMAIAMLRQPRTSLSLIRGSLQALKGLETATYQLLLTEN